MTIKQAVSWLSQPGILAMIHDPTTKKAVRVAIKALSALGTDLAELGTDCISRKAAIDVLNSFDVLDGHTDKEEIKERIERLPPAQSDIIYCKDCVKHNKGLGNYEVHPDGSSTWIWKDSACPLVSWRGKAQGHEFDYQFCAYAERREVTE